MTQSQNRARPASGGRKPLHLAVHYGLAAGAVTLATLLRFPLEPFLHRHAPYALYYLPILVVAWYCGVGPTLLATGLSLASARIFFLRYTEPGSTASLLLFLLVSGAMVALARAARRIREDRETALATARHYEQAADFAVWEWQPGDSVVQSHGLPALLGLDPSAVAPTLDELRVLLHPDDLPRVERQLGEALESGRQFRLECRVRSPRRGERWLSSVGEVTANRFLVRARIGDNDLTVFADGRAIVGGTKDAAAARALYARYVGA